MLLTLSSSEVQLEVDNTCESEDMHRSTTEVMVFLVLLGDAVLLFFTLLDGNFLLDVLMDDEVVSTDVVPPGGLRSSLLTLH